MRLLSLALCSMMAVLASACDFWPRNLEPLTESIARQVSGETTAWRVGGDVVVITVAGSPLYGGDPTELATAATRVAAQAIEFSTVPLESVVITFHETEVSEDPETTREFIFLVEGDRPALQPHMDFDATGPLTVTEVRNLMIDRMVEPLSDEQRECVLREVEERARAAGDPETLDPATVELLPAENWDRVDAFGRRLVLAQAIATKAFFVCARHSSA